MQNSCRKGFERPTYTLHSVVTQLMILLTSLGDEYEIRIMDSVFTDSILEIVATEKNIAYRAYVSDSTFYTHGGYQNDKDGYNYPLELQVRLIRWGKIFYIMV